MSIERRLRRIMRDPERETELRKFAQELGCSLHSTYDQNGNHYEDEVIRRVREAARSIREERLWLIALISAVASIVSALAAWFAVFRHAQY